MNALFVKMWRTIWKTKGQFLAIGAVVMLGVAIYISMTTAFYNLNQTQQAFYQEYNFAHYYFHVVAAPQDVLRQVEQVPGVTRATVRLQKDVTIIKEGQERATARLVSFPLPMDLAVNKLLVQTGRPFDYYPRGGGIEVLVDPPYALANNLAQHDQISIATEGRVVTLTVVGTAISPEFVYIIKDVATLLPEPETFGIVMLPTNQAQQLLNMPDQINQVLVNLAPGVDEEEVAAAIRAILEPYGNLADYPRSRQISHAMLQAELDGLAVVSRILPGIFLGLAAAIQLVLLGRMVRTQRPQIGVMKALGYDNRRIMLHYTGYALLVGILGAVSGVLLGLGLASSLSDVFAMYFNLPDPVGGLNVDAIWQGIVACLIAAGLAGFWASRGVTMVHPAESMRPESPKGSGQIILERWPRFWRLLDPAWKMSLRSVFRNWMRSLVTVIGLIFTVTMLIMSLFANDSIDYLLNQYYFKNNKYDFLIRFNQPIKEGEMFNITRLPGVVKAESLLELPVKIHYLGRVEEDAVVGLPLDLTLRNTGEKLPRSVPEQGILLSRPAAEKLGVKVGDRVVLETILGIGPNHRSELTVVGINQQLLGEQSWVSLDQANRLLRERGLISGAMLKTDPGLARQVELALQDMTGIASITSRQKDLAGFAQHMEAMVYVTGIMILCAALLGFAMVYNASLMSFNERKYHLASLRVLGFTPGEISAILLRETLFLGALGIGLGLPLGDYLARLYVRALSTDVFTMPVVIYPQTYLLAAFGTALFVLLAHFLAAREIKKLAMVEVLKDRE